MDRGISVDEISERLKEMRTDLNKISFLEKVLKRASSFEVKRFIYGLLSELYESRKMLEKAARAMSSKAGAEVTFREKIESYLKAAELFASVGKVDDSEEMFTRALRDANPQQKEKIKLARKNIYLVNAEDLDKKGRKGSAVKFYEKLMKIRLDDLEKEKVKSRLIEIYKSLGKFREARLLEG